MHKFFLATALVFSVYLVSCSGGADVSPSVPAAGGARLDQNGLPIIDDSEASSFDGPARVVSIVDPDLSGASDDENFNDFSPAYNNFYDEDDIAFFDDGLFVTEWNGFPGYLYNWAWAHYTFDVEGDEVNTITLDWATAPPSSYLFVNVYDMSNPPLVQSFAMTKVDVSTFTFEGMEEFRDSNDLLTFWVLIKSDGTEQPTAQLDMITISEE